MIDRDEDVTSLTSGDKNTSASSVSKSRGVNRAKWLFKSRLSGRGQGTLSSREARFIGTFYVAVAQGCHAIVVRDKVLGHEVDVERQRGQIVGCLDPYALAQIEVLRQPRLL